MVRICLSVVEPSCPNDTAELRGSVLLQHMKVFFHRMHKKIKRFAALQVVGKNGGKQALYFLTKNHYMMIIMEYLVPKIEELW